ncbi:hypothetical protein CPLU01_15433 [Colletotrichum plurivorum]|uniref:Uncharacterized protein n=1 Tax=Colletotrichum plurivorum TaxID=2175906 RepID=A0A8H6MVJ4_9PEZI|nr:hypothetical protein CPLU01_15433 [Colletotrichum plurivorum]
MMRAFPGHKTEIERRSIPRAASSNRLRQTRFGKMTIQDKTHMEMNTAFIESEGRKFERARGRRRSRGIKA